MPAAVLSLVGALAKRIDLRQGACAVRRASVGECGDTVGVGEECSWCVDGDGPDESSEIIGVGGDELTFRDGALGDFYDGAESWHAD